MHQSCAIACVHSMAFIKEIFQLPSSKTFKASFQECLICSQLFFKLLRWCISHPRAPWELLGLPVALSHAWLLWPVSSFPHTSPSAGALSTPTGTQRFRWHQYGWGLGGGRANSALKQGQKGQEKELITPELHCTLLPLQPLPQVAPAVFGQSHCHSAFCHLLVPREDEQQPVTKLSNRRREQRVFQCLGTMRGLTRIYGSHRKKSSQLNCVYLGCTGNHHHVADARQVLALSRNNCDLPTLNFQLCAFLSSSKWK